MSDLLALVSGASGEQQASALTAVAEHCEHLDQDARRSPTMERRLAAAIAAQFAEQIRGAMEARVKPPALAADQEWGHKHNGPNIVITAVDGAEIHFINSNGHEGITSTFALLQDYTFSGDAPDH